MTLRRAILSAGIAFHLLVMIVIPNASSHWHGQFAKILFPYTNLIGLHNKWAFFSPDPSPAVAITYEMKREGKTIAKGEFPEAQPPYFRRGFYNRKISTVRFIEQYPHLIEDVYPRILCPQYPEADAIELSNKIYKINGLEDLAKGRPLNAMGEYVIKDVKLALCVRD